MKGEIADALIRYGDRLKAASEGRMHGGDAREAVRASLSGFDLDWDEFDKKAYGIALSLSGLTSAEAAKSGFLAGLSAGLLIAESRHRKETK